MISSHPSLQHPRYNGATTTTIFIWLHNSSTLSTCLKYSSLGLLTSLSKKALRPIGIVSGLILYGCTSGEIMTSIALKLFFFLSSRRNFTSSYVMAYGILQREQPFKKNGFPFWSTRYFLSSLALMGNLN